MKLLVVIFVVLSVSLAAQDESKSRSSFEEEALYQHNFYRKMHGVLPLKLDRQLTRQAQEWANHLAQSNLFEHNPNRQGAGENIYMSSRSLTGKDAVDSWYSENRLYTDYNNDPSISGYPPFEKIGHFTQLVWKGTNRVGVAKATSSSGRTIVVANYSPPGNVDGLYVANVLPPNV